MANLQTFLSGIPEYVLDNPIDHRNKNPRGQIIPKDLGRIADEMEGWEGNIAEALGLSLSDVASIKGKHRDRVDLQKREALNRWKSSHTNPTPRALMRAFYDAREFECVKAISRVLGGDTNIAANASGSSPATPLSQASTTSNTSSLAIAFSGQSHAASSPAIPVHVESQAQATSSPTIPAQTQLQAITSPAVPLSQAAVTFSTSMSSAELEEWLLREITQPEHVKNIKKLQENDVNGATFASLDDNVLKTVFDIKSWGFRQQVLALVEKHCETPKSEASLSISPTELEEQDSEMNAPPNWCSYTSKPDESTQYTPTTPSIHLQHPVN